MSKFFRAGASSDSETESESGDEVPVRVSAPAKPVSFLPSDDEEDQKRVVRTAKDKRYSELKDMIKQLRNSKKIKDMSKILTIFEDLGVAYQKAKSVIEKEGGFVPRFYLRYLAELEDFIHTNWEDKESKKNLSKNNAKSLATLRQKARKYARDFEVDIEAYKQNRDPEGYSSDEEEVVSDEEIEDEPVKKVVEAKKSKYMKKGSDDEESDWAMSSSSDESEEDFGGKTMEELRKFFLKSTVTKPVKEKDRRKLRAERDRREMEDKDDDDAGWESVPGAQQKIEMFAKDAEITAEAVLKKLNEIMASRGKRGTDKKELVDLLKELYTIATLNRIATVLLLKIKFGIIAAQFDYNPKYYDCLPYAIWRNILNGIEAVLETLKENPNIACSADVSEENENLTDPARPYQVQACLLTVFERLDEEFTKILQEADCHSNDYVEKLKAEKEMCSLIDNIRDYLEAKSAPGADLCRIYIRRLEHTYYKFDQKDSNRQLVDALCQKIYRQDDRRLRVRAMLCQIYHQALHGCWHKARDLLLMSHLQATVDTCDINTQILYNRAICQFGLCSFKHGFIQEAFNALTDFQGGGKVKELLAQGLSMVPKGQERSPEQEKLERQRQLPYHMHINLDLLECVYLISAMLLEVPQMAAKDLDGRRGARLSRSFHYQLKQNEKQCLIGQPENTREHVVAAVRALLRGDWKACRDFIINDKMNAKVWNLFHNGDDVKAMLTRRIQEEALRTYLFTYSSIYDSISLAKLSEMFDLDKKAVHSLISKMIIQEDLSASLDEPAEIIVIHRIEPTRLQSLGLQLTDRLKALAENLDQAMEPKTTSGYTHNKQNWYGHGQRQGGQQEGGRRQQQQKNY